MSGTHWGLDRAAVHRLKTIHTQLQSVYAGIVVVTAALRGQGAEQDEEIARVLQSLIGDRLARQIELLDELIDSQSPRVRDCVPAVSWDEWRRGADSYAGGSFVPAPCRCEDVRSGYARASVGEDVYMRWTMSPGDEHAFAAWQSSPRNRLSVWC